MTWFVNSLRTYPELAFFLTLAIGYAVGKIQIGSFKVGSVTGVLITGVVIGQLNIAINPTVKAIFFLLFLFALGYNAGPQFFKGLKKDGIPQVIFSIIVCTIGLISVVVAGKVLNYNAGQASGLAAGALTQSACIGVAQDAINKLGVAANAKKTMSDFVPVGYAVTYIFGTIGTAFILSTLGPKILGVNLEEESKKLEGNDNKVVEGHGVFSGAREVDFRVFAIADDLVGKTVVQVEAEERKLEKIRCFIIRIRRGDKVITPKKDTIIEKNDHIAFSFRTDQVENLNLDRLGKEIDDYELLNFPLENLKVYVKNSKIANQSIEEIRSKTLTRGVFISKLEKTGEEIPYENDTVVMDKETLTLTGPKEEVERLAYKIGKPIYDTAESDVVFLALGILIGGLIGIPAIVIGGVGLNLSTSGGALVMGLIFGLIHSRRPNMGNIPEAAIWFLNNVGLAAFVAVVGIDAGPGFVAGFKASGLSFFLAGVIVTIVPTIAGILIGKYIFKWEAPIILGAVAGALTTTAAIGAICEKAKSNAPVLGYTVTYAVGNILLTVWGSIIILFFAR